MNFIKHFQFFKQNKWWVLVLRGSLDTKNFELQKEKWEKRKLKGKKKHIIQFLLICEVCALVFATLNVLFNKTNTLSDNIIGYFIFIIMWGVLGIWLANRTWKNSSKFFDK